MGFGSYRSGWRIRFWRGPTEHSLISSRFDRLSLATRRALEWAAILGSVFSAEEDSALLETVMGKEAATAITELFERKYLSERAVYPYALYQFTHDLIHEVALEHVGKGERKKMHAQVGQFLHIRSGEKSENYLERIADHLLQGDDEQAAVTAALSAGQYSEEFYRFPQALLYFSEAEKRWIRLKEPLEKTHEIYIPHTSYSSAVGECRL